MRSCQSREAGGSRPSLILIVLAVCCVGILTATSADNLFQVKKEQVAAALAEQALPTAQDASAPVVISAPSDGAPSDGKGTSVSPAMAISENRIPLRSLILPGAPSEPVLRPEGVPTNDVCGGAEVIPAAGPFPHLTAVTPDHDLATDAGDPLVPATCFADPAASPEKGIWYAFTPAASGQYGFSVCTDAPTGTTMDDTIMSLYTSAGGCGGPFTALPGACDDDGCTNENFQSNIGSASLNAGTTYYLVVYNWHPALPPTPGNTATQVRVTRSAAPANDTCALAAPLTLNIPVVATNNLANNDYTIGAPGAACFQGLGQTPAATAGRDVVYSFTAPSAGSYSFQAINNGPAGAPGADGNLVLWTSPSCPAAPPTASVACDPTLWAANREADIGGLVSSEKVHCRPMAASETVYVFVDEVTLSATGQPYELHVHRCTIESEPANNTQAGADIPVCTLEGSSNPDGDADFFTLGSPVAGSRVQSIVQSIYANNTDFDMRITNATDTLEFDDSNNSGVVGGNSPNVAGTILDGGPSYIRLSRGISGSVALQQPYRLFTHIQNPGPGLANTNSVAEIEPNFPTLATMQSSPSNYWSGNQAGGGADGFSFGANIGDVITLHVDGDPFRDNTPTNMSAFLFAETGAQLLGNGDIGATSSIVPSPGTLVGTTPFSPAEPAVWVARYSGAYYAVTQGGSAADTGDYLYSVGINCLRGDQIQTDLSITKTGPVTSPSGDISYTITVINNGAQAASGVSFTDTYTGPPGTSLVSLTLPAGKPWACTQIPGVSFTCSLGGVGSGIPHVFTLVLNTPQCSGNGALTNEIDITSLTFDTNLSNNSAVAVTAVTDDGTCSDGNACTSLDSCVDGECDGGAPTITCDDGVPCTDNICNPADGTCTNPNTECNDNNTCTDDFCDTGLDECVFNPDDNFACTDNSECTTDLCQNGECISTPFVFCEDNNPCTTNFCNPASGVCNYPPDNTALCTDGDPCTFDVCLNGVCESSATSATYTSGDTIVINDNAVATPYPSTLTIPDSFTINSILVRINGFTHTFPDDVDFMLVGPGGQQATIISDVGGDPNIVGVNLILDDAAASSLPDAGPIVSGTFKPTNIGGADDTFPAPAPAQTGASVLAPFVGTNANGVWRLFVVDAFAGDLGGVQSWSLTLGSSGGASCDDGFFCTEDDACVDGVCTGTPRDCSSPKSIFVSFENPPYTPGSVHAQDGWSSTGPYDQEVKANTYGYGSFGPQTWRISNAVTSGSFGDHSFSKPITNEVGESTADNGGMSGGDRKNHFEAQWDFASTVPGAEQPGLSVVASPDRGDGARMSWVQMLDTPSGLEVNFFNYRDLAPFGSNGNHADGCGDEDNFFFSNVVSALPRNVPHTIRITLDTLEGPRNDVVRVYVDGVLEHIDTSWEDYYRWCDESLPSEISRTVDSVLFRTGGAAAPATDGFGFVIDNLSVQGSYISDGCGGFICDEATDSCVPNTDTEGDPCDDGNACTTGTTCQAGICTGGTAVICNDNNACTLDSCDPVDGCVFDAAGANGNACGSASNTDCDNPDTCFNGACVANNEPNGFACNDLSACTNPDACQGGVCVGTPVVICNDNNACTDDTCNPTSGTCVFTPDDTNLCSDGNACTAPDVCRAGQCICGAAGVCSGTTLTFEQPDDLVIPTTVSTVSSNLVVAGAAPYLLDLNLLTTLTHSFSSDLDFTLRSPAGTIVTVSTDNGGALFNVFNGTTWDDDADADGQVPYTTNAGLVTDHPYVNNTAATPLVSEEALAAFIGENPNGTWTLTISDDSAGDGGLLSTWSLVVSSRPTGPLSVTTNHVQAVPTVIPLTVSTVSSTLVVPPLGGPIGKVRLTTALTHTFNGDLDVTLRSPAGTIMTLTTDNAGGNDNVYNGTLWDDDADADGQVPYVTNAGLVTDHPYVNNTPVVTLEPEESFGAFIGEDPAGTWTITISDDSAGDGGNLASWTLEITTASCPGDCTVVCNDNNPCTDDSCVPATGCVYTPNNANTCNDSNACTANDHCDAGQCVGTTILCNDNNVCTDDTCDPATGCVYSPDDTNTCTDNNACTGPDVCRGGACVCGNFVACPPPTTVTARNSTVTPIPDSPATTTSTVSVGGAGSYLVGLRMFTAISHSFSADLDMTITSPAGTIVSFSTDNGGLGPDNVLNGTVWDDNADPDGQVPYVNNDNLATDHLYVNNVLASPLAPEEAFAAFRGENPNGTWTLRINDDASIDTGTLTEWSLEVATIPSAPFESTAPYSNAVPVAIPDGGVASSTIVVAGSPTRIAKVVLSTSLVHTDNSDLDVTIQSPSGTVVTLTTDNGGAGLDNVYNGTLWDDDANPGGQVPYLTNNGLVGDHLYVDNVLASPLAPEEALGAFADENPNGVWTITLSDDATGDLGSLNSWSLRITTYECAGSCDVICNDNNPCTDDVCNPTSGCVYTPDNTNNCTDNNACTTDSCLNGFCQNAAINCNDNNKCTNDSCDPITGCVNAPLNCNDGNACTTDSCNPQTGCVNVTISCNDNNACTNDSCNPSTGCVNAPVVCNDNNPCTTDACDPATGCTTVTRDCNDANKCTNDSCNPATGQCVNTPLVCNDSNACTTDTCNTATGCVYVAVSCSDGNACTNDSCSPTTGCVNTPVSCNDNNACTTDSCDPASGCRNVPVVCNDNNACTNDSCNPSTGCVSTPVVCNDGNACTTDACNPASGCTTTAVNCNDANKCTNDSCNPASGCVNTAVVCNDQNACTNDSCNPASGCVYVTKDCNDGNACTDDSCDPAIGCRNVNDNTNPCSDGNACTSDACVNGTCSSATISCNDNNACTFEFCDPAFGCVYKPVTCQDDNNPCTAGYCDTVTGCHQDPINCTDSNPCTTDTCNPATGACEWAPLNCNDGNACTADSCDATGCRNVPITCDDHNPCTDDNCSPANGCVAVNDNGNTCSDNNAGTTDTCQNGVCVSVGGGGSSCDDGNPCTIDAGSPASGCTHQLVDADGDGVCDSTDNCRTVANTNQVDQDHDGIGDACDESPLSDARPKVIVRNCNTNVVNDVLSSGSTIADLVARCRNTTSNQHDYLACVWALLGQLRADGHITGAEASKILRCASRRRDHESRHGGDRSDRDDNNGGGNDDDSGQRRGRRDNDSDRGRRNHGQRGRGW